MRTEKKQTGYGRGMCHPPLSENVGKGCVEPDDSLLDKATNVLIRLRDVRHRLARIDRRLELCGENSINVGAADESLSGRLQDSQDTLSQIENHLGSIEEKLLGTNYGNKEDCDNKCAEPCGD